MTHEMYTISYFSDIHSYPEILSGSVQIHCNVNSIKLSYPENVINKDLQRKAAVSCKLYAATNIFSDQHYLMQQKSSSAVY